MAHQSNSYAFQHDHPLSVHRHTFSARGLKTHYQIREQDFLNLTRSRGGTAMRWTRYSKQDRLRLMIFADSRYNRHDKRNKLPRIPVHARGLPQS
jgi:hypothetical protein